MGAHRPVAAADSAASLGDAVLVGGGSPDGATPGRPGPATLAVAGARATVDAWLRSESLPADGRVSLRGWEIDGQGAARLGPRRRSSRP
ncbi:hypothetical protein Pla133_06180 [Planctomycetes bacterium Pla133]|uniref:Uncharacterized protein n=1 Tax=Engelhardtia mirabilis TaxID=2528011 RepID=A0A518BF79_9BACT|nr:hypothetical protein Pla133_06180 [Planctomycetes bacterium Pla133]